MSSGQAAETRSRESPQGKQSAPEEGTRFLSREGKSTLVSFGLERRPFGDLYHYWLVVSWTRVLVVLSSLYIVVNAIFALGFLATGGIDGARDGSFSDAYFFSVQTLATIGYGKMSPVSLPAHLLVTFESFCGLIGVAMATGLMFAKFARPTARILWSKVALVSNHEGIPSLMFRVANERGNAVVEAQMRLGVLSLETTAEGGQVRRMHDLKLLRASSAVFALSWLAVHPITPDSFLYGKSAESLRDLKLEIFVSLTGLDGTFSQTIHDRHSYMADEILWGRRFKDILGVLPDGRRGVNYQAFHDTEPATPRAP